VTVGQTDGHSYVRKVIPSLKVAVAGDTKTTTTLSLRIFCVRIVHESTLTVIKTGILVFIIYMLKDFKFFNMH
jgi:hypothetical protein